MSRIDDIENLIYSKDFRNRLMDMVKCLNFYYMNSKVKDETFNKDAWELREFGFRREMYLILCEHFGLGENSSVSEEKQDAANQPLNQFASEFSDYASRLVSSIEKIGFDADSKRLVAVLVAGLVSVAAEDTRQR